MTSPYRKLTKFRSPHLDTMRKHRRNTIESTTGQKGLPPREPQTNESTRPEFRISVVCPVYLLNLPKRFFARRLTSLLGRSAKPPHPTNNMNPTWERERDTLPASVQL